MKIKNIIIPLMLALTMAFPSAAYAASGQVIQLHGGYNYTQQYMTNWCWAATGLNIFVAIDETIPSSKTNKAFLLELVKDVVDNSEHLKPTSGSTEYERYDIAAGLAGTAEIATDLLKSNGYRNIYYTHDTGDGADVRPFDYIMDDLKVGYPVAIWLYPTSASSNKYSHIVLIIGADSTWNDEDDYDVKIYDSDKDEYVWVTYADLVAGTSKLTNYKRYEATCEYQVR